MKDKKKNMGGSISDNARRRALSHSAGRDTPTISVPSGVSLFWLKNDKPVRVNVLAYKVGKGNPYADEGTQHYERTFWVHRGVGPDGRGSFICTSKSFAKRCAGCDAVDRARKNETLDDDELKALRPKERQLFKIIDLAEPEKGVQIWEVSFHTGPGKILDEMIQNEDEGDDYDKFASLKDGKTLKLGVSEDKVYGCSVKSVEFKSRKPIPIEDSMPDLCLDDLLKPLSYDEQQKLIDGKFGDDSDDNNSNGKEVDVKKIRRMTEKELVKFCAVNDIDLDKDDFKTLKDFQDAVIEEMQAAVEDDEEKSTKKASKKSSKTSKKSSKDEEEEEEEEDDDDEDDDDEDDDDDDDDDDDEKPKKKGKK